MILKINSSYEFVAALAYVITRITHKNAWRFKELTVPKQGLSLKTDHRNKRS